MRKLLLIYAAAFALLLSACGDEGGSGNSVVVVPGAGGTGVTNTPVTDTWKGTGATLNGGRAESMFRSIGATYKQQNIFGDWTYIYPNPFVAAQKEFVQRSFYSQGCSTEEYFRTNCMGDFFVQPMNHGCQKQGVVGDDNCKYYVGQMVIWVEYTEANTFKVKIQGISNNGIWGSDSKKIMSFEVEGLTDIGNQNGEGFKIQAQKGEGYIDPDELITFKSTDATLAGDSFNLSLYYGNTQEDFESTKIWTGTVQRKDNQ